MFLRRNRRLLHSRRFFSQISGLNPDQKVKAMERDIELRKNHLKSNENNDEEAYRKKLIYRSKQRGWLEVDLILGTWAEQNIPNLEKTELEEYEKILNLETIEIFYAVSKPDKDVPDSLKSATLTKIREFAKTNPFQK